MSVLSRPYFHNEEAAFAYLETALWPNGPVCSHCGCTGRITKVKANPEKRIRAGLWRCGDCKGQFRVTVGTVFEHARIPLHKVVQAVHLLTSSKKGISAHQIHRTLEITYKAAWFLCHRIREAVRDGDMPIMGGPDGVVEVDETYVGGKAKNRAYRTPAPKKAVLSLVERDGKVRSFHVRSVTAENVRPIIAKNADRASSLMTDEKPDLSEGRQGLRLPRHGEPQRQRVRPPRRLHPRQHGGELLLHRQARDHGHVPQLVRGAPASVSR